QAEVGKRGYGAEAERSRLMLDQGLTGAESLAVGPAGPGRDLVLRQAELAQPRQHFQVLHRMGIAGQHLREGAHPGAIKWILWQQRRQGMGLVEPFDDGERLRDDRTTIVFQG